MNQSQVPSQAQLEAWVHEWQGVLSLPDWIVTVLYQRGNDIEGNEGRCHIARSLKRAVIEILDPGDHLPNPRHPCDAEETIIHELLHLHVSGFEPKNWNSPAGVAAEQAI